MRMPLYNGICVPGKPDLENVRRLDLLPIPMVRKMHRLGIAVDVPYLQEFSVELGHQLVELERDIANFIPPESLHYFSAKSAEIDDADDFSDFNANSSEQKRTLLYDVLKIGRDRDIKKTASGKLSTGKKILERMREEHPVIAKMLAYSERAKLKSAFADSLPRKAKFHPRNLDGSCPVCELPHVDSTWRIHTEFPMTRTETGRFASKNPNLQTIPARSELGGRIRMAFVASPSTRLVSSDFSQIELRDLAHAANAKSMIDVYNDDKDIHLYTACRTFGKDYDHFSHLSRLKEQGKLPAENKVEWADFSLNCRLPSKNVNFLIAYGATAIGLQAQLALSGLYWSEEQCDEFILNWFALYPEVRSYMELNHYRARRYGYVWDAFGRIRRVPETQSFHAYIRSAGLRQCGNMPIQATSAGQTKLVMGELDEHFSNIYSDGQGSWVWPLLTIHDQLMVEADEEIASDISELMKHCFSHVMDDKQTGESLWRVPIKSDGEILERWKKE